MNDPPLVKRKIKEKESEPGFLTRVQWIQDEDSSSEGRRPFHLSLFFLMFGIGAILLVVMFLHFPELESEQKQKLKLPRDFADLREISSVISLYKDNYFFTVMIAFCATFIFLQTFSIPGSIFLSFLSGALFGLPLGVFLVSVLSTIGATNCYALSYFIGRNLIRKFFPERLESFGREIEKHRSHLLNYMLFLRLTPLLPNWFVNISSPLLGVPLRIFLIGTFFGVMPQTFVAVRAGLTIQTINSLNEVIDINIILSLFALGLMAILPTMPQFQRTLNRLLFKEKNPQ